MSFIMSSDYEKEYLVNLMKNVSKLEHLCDVTLVAGIDGEKFNVHRTIMLASSPYFNALLGPNYNEAKKEEIKLTIGKIDGRTLKTIIHFCYTGRVEITDDTVDNIMAAASSMEMVQLEQRCSNFWSEKLNIDRCVEILVAGDKYNLKSLWEKSLEYVCMNLVRVPAAHINQIDGKSFKAILAADNITTTEENVFDCFVRWVQYDEANRSQFVATLANFIRLKNIPVHILCEKVEPFYEKHGCEKRVMDEYRDRARDSGGITLQRFKEVDWSVQIRDLDWDNDC